MALNLDILTLEPLELFDKTIPEFIPDVLPPSMIDVDRMPPMEIAQPMSEACPACGGFCMQVGDYVCWGVCWKCFAGAI